MRRLFFTLICFLFLAFVSSTGARMNMLVVAGAPADSEYCSACPDDTNNADLLCEDANGASGRCTWTEVIDDQGAINYSVSAGSNWECTDLGSEVIEIDVSDLNAGDAVYIHTDLGSGQTDVEGKIYLRFSDLSGIEVGEQQRIMNLHTSTTEGSYGDIYASVQNNAGTYRMVFKCDDSESTSNIVNDGRDYEFRFKWDSATTCVIDWGEPGSTANIITDNTVDTSSPRYLILGRFASTNDAAYKMEVLGALLDDDTEPTDCTE